MRPRRYRAAVVSKRTAHGSSDDFRSRLALIIIEKFLLVLVTAGAIAFLQNRLQLSQQRLEKARRIGEISVDRPVAIVAELPTHLDAFILYAAHIRSRDVDDISSEHLTKLQAAVSSDIEASRSYYGPDEDLRVWGTAIKAAVADVRAKALNKRTLDREDLDRLENARDLASKFHGRIIQLSVDEALKRFDDAYSRSP